MRLHTGGAAGADFVFAERAALNNISVIIHSFPHHKLEKNNSSNIQIVEHSFDDLRQAYPFCDEARQSLNRHIPIKEYSRNLILRDYFQIKDSQCVFAVAPLLDKRTVAGGTGWAIQMAIQKKIQILLFNDGMEKHWFYFSYKNMSFTPTHSNTPTGFIKTLNLEDITGIGSRKISPQGIEAINSLFC